MFIETVAPSWDEITKELAHKPLWAFRGQVDSSWTLETSLERESKRHQVSDNTDLSTRENWLLYQFRRYAHQHKSDLPPESNIIDWLTLIQHYGGPTRLLDFSYSIYVAAFFAIETAEKDAAIWVINLPTLSIASQKRFNFKSQGRIDEVRRDQNAKFEELVRSNSNESAVFHIEPDRMHERLWAQ